MNYLFALALLSLFTAFKLETDLVQIRPFEVFVAVLLVLTLLNGKVRAQNRLLGGFLLLLSYFSWHMLSATTYGLENGLREGLQITVVTAFAFTLAVQADKIDYAKFGRLMLIGLVLITAYNIYWHISLGFWTGWKRLIDPKAAFTFLPLCVGCLLLFSPGKARKLYWLLWAALGVVILLSGERKAVLAYLIIWAAIAARGRLLAAVPAIAASILALALFGSIVEDPYLQQQVRSVFNPVSSILPVTAIANGEIPDSMSNAQRLFALRLSTEMFLEHPVIGVGTNAYSDIVRARFAYLPEYMQNAPHNEFLRILAENGLIGFTLYLSFWIVAFVRLRHVLNHLVFRMVIRHDQASVLQVVLLVPLFIYVSFEGSGTDTFVVLIIALLLPKICYSALLSRRQYRGGESETIPAHFRTDPGRRAHAQ